ncbi:MAG: metallophosphoesterase family protein [Planctomycetes bacterium]|nr:metallophosphoesterase family protein [Planctomycetota bacterium]
MTTFALISDLHANLEALTAVFARIDQLGVQRVHCLGDVVGYGADPEPCVRLVMQRCVWTLMGNHDYGLFHDLRDFNPLAAEALFFTRRKLRPRWFGSRKRALWNYLQTLPHRREDYGFLFVHGSPRDPIMEYVLKSDPFFERDKMRSIFALLDRPCFVGHTHWPGVHGPDYSFRQATDDFRSFRLDGAPAIVNVGSVGQPRDCDPRACFVVVDDMTVEFHRVSYDFRATQRKILAAGLHPRLAERLALGR